MNRPPQVVPESDLVTPLERLGRRDLARAGGKGANLGELTRAGFPVPPGFVVTTVAYERCVAFNGLEAVLARALSETPRDGAALRAAFEAAAIPPDVEHGLRAAYAWLGQPPVAVRSSATAEDLPEAAFAGQQDTYLNLAGIGAVLDAVRRCWASLWTDRAIAYRERQGVDQRSVRLAVVVQRLVPAEAAGVMFTANPVTGARDEVIVDASPGLGEAVVSGLVTADHYVLRRGHWPAGWRIVERRPGRREVVIRARAGGGTEHEHRQAGGESATPAVPDRALRRLAALSVRLERHFGAPQDVEWAWAGGALCILQARPITALPAPPPRANRLQWMLAGTFGEIFAVRPYPLDATVWLPALAGAVDPLFELAGVDYSLGRLFVVEDGVIVRAREALPRPTWRTLLVPAKLIARSLRYDPVHWQADPELAAAQALMRALEAQDPRAQTWEALLAALRSAMQVPLRAAGVPRARYLPGAALATARLRLLLAVLGQGRRFGALLSGVENKTMEVNQALETLVQTVGADPELASIFAAHAPEALWPALEAQPAGRVFLAKLERFLDGYGHREAVVSTAKLPTWKDAPEVVLGMVKSFAVHPSARPPGREGPSAWEAARDATLAHPLLSLPPVRHAFLGSLVRARLLMPIREDTHFYAALPLPVIRRAALELGRRLAEASVLDAPEDVFHLLLDELADIDGIRLEAQAGGLRAAAERRKAARAALEDTPMVDPRLYLQTAPAGDALLRGMPGSPGVAEGPARIVRDSAEFDKLQPGDVLVAPYTNPAWTPLFQRAVAVVVDSGSVGSHAAIVAREYGLPAVMSTVTGTRTLKDGERVRVDGGRGVVERVESA